jgi:AbrB family looped-hinge helix DNA binding protein
MQTRLSSKGQVVIPKPVREALALHGGVEFDVRLEGNKIILEPLTGSPVDALYAKYAGVDLLGDLEEEHRQELSDDAALRA